MAIKSEGFVDIDMKTFETILARETLNCKEIHLFEAALTWVNNLFSSDYNSFSSDSLYFPRPMLPVPKWTLNQRRQIKDRFWDRPCIWCAYQQ